MIRFGPYYYATGIKPEIIQIYPILSEAAVTHGKTWILSSGIDRKHGEKSLHYAGMAVDITWDDYNPIDGKMVRDALKSLFGPQYDVVVEANHIHIEFQPKLAVNEHWRAT